MIHKGDTQPEEISMTSGVALRNGIYKYRRRIPTDLWEHPKYVGLKTKEINKSLGTRDPREANRIAANVVAELENEFAACRHELSDKGGKSGSEELVSTPVVPFLRRSKVTISEIDMIWVAEYEKLARKAVTERDEWLSLEQEQKDEVLSIKCHECEAVLNIGGDNPSNCNWGQIAEYHLEVNSIAKGDLTDEDFQYLVARLKAVELEILQQDIDVLEGKSPKLRDKLLILDVEKVKKSRQTVQVVSATTENHVESGVRAKEATVADVRDFFLKHKADTKPKSIEKGNYNTAMAVMCDFFGAETVVHSITVQSGFDLVKFLQKVPANAKKIYPDKTLVEASKLECQKPTAEQRFLDTATQRTTFTHIKAAFRAAKDGELTRRNVLDNGLMTETLPPKKKPRKIQISELELTRVLGAKGFQKHRSAFSSCGLAHAGKYWAILLCMHHGMRLNEACQLHISDVAISEGIYYLKLIDQDAEGNSEKSLKSENSIRIVPIHQKVIDLGFIDFVEYQKSIGTTPFLFPELEPTNKKEHTNDFSKNVSRAFSRLVDNLIDPSLRPNHGDKKAHTLRHKIAMKLRLAGVEAETRYHLLGWVRRSEDEGSDMGNSEEHSGWHYGRSIEELPSLQSVLNTHVVFPEFDYGVLETWCAES